MSVDAVAVGVDVATARKGLDLVALDAHRRVVESAGRLSCGDVARIVAALRPAVVCIDSPPCWAGAGCRSRAAERALLARGIHCFFTGDESCGGNPFYGWMLAGFRVFEAVAETHPLYRGGPVAGTAAEVFPNATALLLAGRRPAPAESKGRFRRAVLDSCGVAQAELPSLDRVDAALAALTGQIALHGGHSWVGDPAEGTILLPAQSSSRATRPR